MALASPRALLLDSLHETEILTRRGRSVDTICEIMRECMASGFSGQIIASIKSGVLTRLTRSETIEVRRPVDVGIWPTNGSVECMTRLIQDRRPGQIEQDSRDSFERINFNQTDF